MPGYIQNPYMPQYGGFGNGNGWWVLIILFAIFGGWGNGAWGRNGTGEAPALISQLRPNPVPAFQVANPFASMYTGCCNNNVAI